MRFLHCVAVIAVAFAGSAFGPDRASAQRLTLDNGFRSPSGNIHCQYFDFDNLLRCDLKAIANRPSPRPRDCENDWGQAFEVSARKNVAGPICHGDTVMDDRLPVLGYGERWQRGDFVCHSDRTGVSCLNSVGAGFELSRRAQTVLRGKEGSGHSGGGQSIGGRVQ